MKKENATSRLAQYLLSACFNKSTSSKISAYSSKHSMSRTLSEQRDRFLSQTEAAIAKFNTLENIYQLQTSIRKLPLEVQYFVAERAIVMSVVSQYDQRLTLDIESSDGLPQKTFQLLHALWEAHLKQLSLDGIDLDTHLSHIYHGHL